MGVASGKKLLAFFCIELQVLAQDQLMWVRFPQRLTEDVKFFFKDKNDYFSKFIPFVSQVELRSSPLWDFHDWYVKELIDRPLILALKLVSTRQEVGRLRWEKDEQWCRMFNVKLYLQMLEHFCEVYFE